MTWQGERGLQIESVPATPLMFLRTFTDNPSWNIFLSPYNALELQGPYVVGLLTGLDGADGAEHRCCSPAT